MIDETIEDEATSDGVGVGVDVCSGVGVAQLLINSEEELGMIELLITSKMKRLVLVLRNC
jgi:hypothetical protein